MKKVISLVIMIVMTACFSISSFALDEEPPVPVDPDEPYTYTQSVSSNLIISGSKATCISTVTGKAGQVTKIDVTQYLQKKIGNTWMNISTWSKVYETTSMRFVNTKTGLGTGSYRVYTVAFVFHNSAYEVVSAYSTVRTI